MDWNFDNPALALEQYYRQSAQFAEKRLRSDLLAGEASAAGQEQSKKRKELARVQKRLQEMGAFSGPDPEPQIQEAVQQADEQIAGIQRDFQQKQAELTAKMEASLQENDSWLAGELQRLLGGSLDAQAELTPAEQKALAFEIERRQSASAASAAVSAWEDEITQETLDCKSASGQWKKEQDSISAQFQPELTRCQSQLDQLHQQYQPEVLDCQDAVSEAVAARDEEVNRLLAERSREIQLANQEISGFQRDFKQTEKQFNEQIRMAKLQGKPTTRMENSKASRLNALNDQIQKVNNRIHKKTSALDQKIDAAQAKHSKRIQKAESQLNQVIQRREQEMEAPKQAYEALLQDRDSQLSGLQKQIDQREATCSQKTEALRRKIQAETDKQSRHIQDLDRQIVDFVMAGNTCFSQVLDESCAPFAALDRQTETWMALLRTIRREKTDACYEAEHAHQKQVLSGMDYSHLIQELARAQQFSGKLSVLAQNSRVLAAVSAALCGAGLLLAVLLYAVLQRQAEAAAGLLLFAGGVSLALLTLGSTKREFAAICRYIALARDYQDFPGISAHSTQITQEREAAALKDLGARLYDVHYGKQAAAAKHAAKDADIRVDFERSLQLLTVEQENARTECERARDRQIARIRSGAAQAETEFAEEKEALQSRAGQLTQKLQALEQTLESIAAEQEENQAFFAGFEKNFAVLQEKLQQSSWVAPMTVTHGRLDGGLYIIPDAAALDDYGHKPVYYVSHSKKPLVFTYDTRNIGTDGASQHEAVGRLVHDLLFDLMYAVYRLNSKEAYDQLVVDAAGGSSDLKSLTVKNAFHITEVAGTLEEVRDRLRAFEAQRERLAEKGVRIDDINEARFQEQERPEVSHIFYLVLKPGERRSRLDDTLRRLLPDCDRYGFFPIFICEQETWARESGAQDTIYGDIQSFVNHPAVRFDGERYFC